MFSPVEMTTVLCFIRRSNNVFFRNFELHQVVKRVELDQAPLSLAIFPKGNFFFVATERSIVGIDYLNEKNRTEKETGHEEIRGLKACPNGRFLVSGGSRGDICLWETKFINFAA